MNNHPKLPRKLRDDPSAIEGYFTALRCCHHSLDRLSVLEGDREIRRALKKLRAEVEQEEREKIAHARGLLHGIHAIFSEFRLAKPRSRMEYKAVLRRIYDDVHGVKRELK